MMDFENFAIASSYRPSRIKKIGLSVGPELKGMERLVAVIIAVSVWPSELMLVCVAVIVPSILVWPLSIDDRVVVFDVLVADNIEQVVTSYYRSCPWSPWIEWSPWIKCFTGILQQK